MRIYQRLGGESAPAPPTGKSFRFVRACDARFRSYVVSNLKMVGCPPYLLSLVSRACIFDFLRTQESFPREFFKRVLQESSPREFFKRVFQDSSPSEFFKIILEVILKERSPRELSQRVLKEGSQREFLQKVHE